MKKFLATTLLLLAFLIVSCEKENASTITPTANDGINYFIWKGLNAYYLWQQEVPDLADNRFGNFDELYSYFRSFSSPENVFESLRYQPNIVDRFSVIVQDYVALENSFQGITLNSGMEFGLVRYINTPSQIFGYVRYVIPNSDAASKGIMRGMIFNSVNGTQLTDINFGNLLFDDNTSYTVGFADYNNGNPTSNGSTISLTKSQVSENPIATTSVIVQGGKKIGYLLYNQFANSYDTQLNAAFAYFKSENIDELIVDLRYNGGGSVQTAVYLGSMITGQFNGSLFSKQVWNDKVQAVISADRFEYHFTDKIRNVSSSGAVIAEENINSLGLSKVYFIVSTSTASASELVINSLSSYIDVYLIGTKTIGKQVGSITLYDSDNLLKNGPNMSQAHRYAMQPIVFEISNANNTNYPNGLIPGSTLPGIQLQEDFGNLGALGKGTEPLLNRALTYITTGAKSANELKNKLFHEEIFNSKLATSISNNMYIDLKID